MDLSVVNEIFSSKYNTDDFVKYLAFAICLRDMYQHFHWGTFGENFYEDHLMYEKLYNSLSEEVDGIAEKLIGLDSNGVVDLIKVSECKNDIFKNLMSDFNVKSDSSTYYEFAMFMEHSFLKISEKLYESLESSGNLTMGLDDLMTAVYSTHEDNIYFLKQKYLSVSLSKPESAKNIEDINTEKENHEEESESESEE